MGLVVSGKGISTNPKKVEAVTKWPTPKTVYDVRSFLGFVGYYRRFIKGFSKISKPITGVITGLENQPKRTAKKTLIEWTEAANSAFETLKELCTSTPILAYPDYQLPFILHTDSAMKYISTLHSIITIGSSYIFRNNYNTYLQFHIVYCRDVIQHKVQVTTDIVCSTSQLHMMLLV